MIKGRSGFRVNVYWEEFGTLKEGSMFDERTVEVVKKPTAGEMKQLEAALEQKAKDLGLVRA